MIQSLSLDDFLKRNGIPSELWQAARLDLKALQEIAADHEQNRERLADSAEQVSRFLQRIEGVHSVGWSVISTEALLAKIVRKRAGKVAKYADLSAANYFAKLPDLIEVRVLQLFQDQWPAVDQRIREGWNLAEKPARYFRKGDSVSEALYPKAAFEQVESPEGYRSLRYVLETRPQLRPVLIEIQVKTAFEDAWSEIDRLARGGAAQAAPMEYLLTSFQRLADQADEMGTFFKGQPAEPAAVEPAPAKKPDAVEPVAAAAPEIVAIGVSEGVAECAVVAEEVRPEPSVAEVAQVGAAGEPAGEPVGEVAEESEASEPQAASTEQVREYPKVGSALKQLSGQAESEAPTEPASASSGSRVADSASSLFKD